MYKNKGNHRTHLRTVEKLHRRQTMKSVAFIFVWLLFICALPFGHNVKCTRL